jgi:hypothetical protein
MGDRTGSGEHNTVGSQVGSHRQPTQGDSESTEAFDNCVLTRHPATGTDASRQAESRSHRGVRGSDPLSSTEKVQTSGNIRAVAALRGSQAVRRHLLRSSGGLPRHRLSSGRAQDGASRSRDAAVIAVLKAPGSGCQSLRESATTQTTRSTASSTCGTARSPSAARAARPGP